MLSRSWQLLKAAVEVYGKEGWNGVYRRLNRKFWNRALGRGYARWIRENERHFRSVTAGGPLISILMPVYNVDPRWLKKAIDSVKRQNYANWELCIADDASTHSGIRPVLEKAGDSDSRIKVTFRPLNGHISEASNSALALVHGEWLVLMDHDDELAPFALSELAAEIQRTPDANLIYSDEDKVNLNNRRYDPYFKPDWNPDLFCSQNYLNHLTAYRTSVVQKVGGFRKGFEGSQDYDLALRVIEQIPAASIRHIPRVLYHWRAIPNSVALARSEKNYPEEAARKALREHFERTGRRVEVVPAIHGWHRVKYALPESLPKVSLIVCTKDQPQLLRQVATGVLSGTDYSNKELIIVDHESRDPETLNYFEELKRSYGNEMIRILPFKGEFNFSAMNNFAARSASGEVLAFLNNDLKVIHSDWLKEMVSHAVRPEIGAVGAKLLYPDGRLQHAGVILGIGGVAGHSHKFLSQNAPGYFGRAQLIQDFSAVTAACMLVRREIFMAVGGFDEANLAVAFNDIDFCLRVRGIGYRILYTPYAQLFHFESISRGSDSTPKNLPRFLREYGYMVSRWGPLLERDPNYSPNLSLESEDFSLGFANDKRNNDVGHLLGTTSKT